jgi:dihydrofolate reductase
MAEGAANPGDAISARYSSSNLPALDKGIELVVTMLYVGVVLIDELHIAIAPVLLGQGEALFRDLDLPALGYQCADHAGSEAATHVILNRKDEREEE